jgi:hypothetical protein
MQIVIVSVMHRLCCLVGQQHHFKLRALLGRDHRLVGLRSNPTKGSGNDEHKRKHPQQYCPSPPDEWNDDQQQAKSEARCRYHGKKHRYLADLRRFLVDLLGLTHLAVVLGSQRLVGRLSIGLDIDIGCA